MEGIPNKTLETLIKYISSEIKGILQRFANFQSTKYFEVI